MPKFHEFIGALLALLAVGAVIYAAIYQNNGEAQGALVAIVVAANSYFLRAKVLSPTNGNTSVPVTVTNPTAPALAPTVPPPAIPDPTVPAAP